MAGYDSLMDYKLKRVRGSRSIKLRVEPSGAVTVRAPYLAPKFLVERFVREQEEWILRQQAKTKLKKTVYPVFDWEGKVVSYLGNLYKIGIREKGERIKIETNNIMVAPVTGLESDAKKMLVTWLKREGEREIRERTERWAKLMGTEYQGIRFRQQKSRWGSCTHDNRLSFNWRLVHFKPEVIDYVVIHELAHTRHHDHSRGFWELAARYDPGYKTNQAFLRKQVLELL